TSCSPPPSPSSPLVPYTTLFRSRLLRDQFHLFPVENDKPFPFPIDKHFEDPRFFRLLIPTLHKDGSEGGIFRGNSHLILHMHLALIHGDFPHPRISVCGIGQADLARGDKHHQAYRLVPSIQISVQHILPAE